MFDIRQSAVYDFLFFAHDANGDAVTGKIDSNFTKRISKNAAAFAALTITITERENGWYHVQLSTAHTNTLGQLSVTFTATGVKQINYQFNVSRMLTNVDKSFNNEVGVKVALDSLAVIATDVNASAVVLTGNGVGSGVLATGGSGSGTAVHMIGGAPNGHGLVGKARGSGSGLRGEAEFTGSGIEGTGGAGSGSFGLDLLGIGTGSGARIRGGLSSGIGVEISASGGNADGMTISKTGTGKDVTGGINVDRIAGDSAAATNQKNAALHVLTVTLQNGPHTNTVIKTNVTEQTSSHYNDRQLYFRTGVLAGQKRDITGYAWDGTNGNFTITAATDIPVNGDIAEVI